MQKHPLAARTTAAPEGTRSINRLLSAPMIPEHAPKKPLSKMVLGNEWVQNLAEAGGITINAITSMTPTILAPTITTTRTDPRSTKSIASTGHPCAEASWLSKHSNCSSLRKSKSAPTTSSAAKINIFASLATIEAVLPRMKFSRPAALP